MGNLLKSPSHGLRKKPFDGFSERVMLRIISVRLKQEKFYSVMTNIMVSILLAIAALIITLLSSYFGSFEYQQLVKLPSLSYVLPGLMTLFALVILDQVLSAKSVRSPNLADDKNSAFSL
jgi:hypothetical protein